MGERFFTTGEAAAMLGVKLREVDYACSRGKAGNLIFCGGRRMLTPANVRNLAKHFGKAVPPECRDDAAPPVIVQQGGRP